jgi:hypothetical protein
MNLRRIAKPIAALLLSVGLVTIGVAAPADADTYPTRIKHDTGWGFR